MQARLLTSSFILAAASVSVLESAPASAQTSQYIATEYSRPFTALSSGMSVSFNNNRVGSTIVRIPFTFEFFGGNYTWVNIGLNGVINFAEPCGGGVSCPGGSSCNGNSVCQEFSFNTGPPFSTPRFPSTSLPDGFVAPFWDDLWEGTTSEVEVATIGTAPNREFVIEYRNIERFVNFAAGTNSKATFQIRLEEGTNVIRIHYGSFTSSNDNFRWSGSIGVESPDGDTWLSTRPCSQFDNCSAADLINLSDTVIEILEPDGAELVANAVSPAGGEPNDPLDISLTVTNVGTRTTTVGFEARVYLSTDTTIDRGDRELGVLNFPALEPGRSATSTVSTVVPNIPIGVYTLGALVDTSSVVPEAVETNNIAIAQPRFLIGADVALDSFTPPTEGGIGDPLSVTIPVRNFGGAQASVAVDIYLSENLTLDAADTKVASATTALGSSLTSLTVTGTVPSNFSQGDFRVIAVVDPGNRIAESDENNNIVVGNGLVSFIAADLFIPRIRADRAIAFRGEEITVTAEIENEGGSGARGFIYEFRLSTNELISLISDPFLGAAGPITVLAGETVTVTHTFTVPSDIAVNDYYVGIVVNSNQLVTEVNTNDNIRRTPSRVVIRDPGPDFTVAEVSAPTAAAAGERLVLERAIFNIGNAGGTTEYDVWLSLDETVEPSQDVLLLTNSATIAIGDEDLGLDTVQLSPTLPPASYYVLYRLDGPDLVDELDETNNIGGTTMAIPVVGVQLQILTESMPFATVNVPYEVVLGVSGGAGQYQWSIPDGALPQGLSLDAMSGRISGTPEREELSRFTLSVTDGLVAVAQDFTVLVSEQSEPMEILTRVLPPASVGRPYRQILTVYGGVPPYRWEVRGTVPDGMTVDPEGVIRGTPVQNDLRQFPVQVTDALEATASRILILKVVRPSQTVQMSSEALPDGRIGDEYMATLSVVENSGVAPYVFSQVDGALPDGVTQTDEMISGIPTKAGLFNVAFRVTDADGEVDINRYLIEIDERNGVRFVTTSLPNGEIGSPYEEEDGDAIKIIAVSEQGSSGILFELVQGALPQGLTLEDDGTIVGTPARRGVFDFVVRATDESNQERLRAYGMLIEDPPAPPAPIMPSESDCSCVTVPSQRLPLGLWALLPVGVFLLRRRRRWGLLLAVFVVAALGASAGDASAQTFNYNVAASNVTYVERTTGGTPLIFTPNNDNGGANFSLPFPFRYYGIEAFSVTVSTNGYITFGGNGTERTNRQIPWRFFGNIGSHISPFWDDLESSGERWFLEGTAPNRRVIIQFANLNARFAPTQGTIKAQVTLYEGRSKFDVHYGGVVNATGSSNWSGSMGFQDGFGTQGENFFPCTPGCTRMDIPANRLFSVQEDEGSNIIALGVDSAASVFPGSSTVIVPRFDSVHGNALGPFQYEIYLLQAAERTPSGSPLVSSTTTLQPFEQRQQPVSITIPADTPLGRYRFALVVDAGDTVSEPNETDNLVFSEFLRVAAPRADLVPQNVVPQAAVGSPGGSFSVDFEIANEGTVDADADWMVLLSRNSVVTADDQMVASGSIRVEGSQTASVSSTFTLPSIPWGDYTLGVIIDAQNTVLETSEVNNSAVAQTPITISDGNLSIVDTQVPPLYQNVPYTSFLRALGGNGTYEWTVTGGTLPRGLALVSTNGHLRGTPVDLGSNSVTIQVQSGTEVASATYQMDVVEPIGTFSIATRQLLPGVVGADYPTVAMDGEPQRLRTLGGTGTVTFSLDSPAPPGLDLQADGTIVGIPVQPGRFSIDIRAIDEDNNVATKTLFLTVAEPGRLTLVADTLPAGRVGEPYQAQLRFIGAASTSTPTFEATTALPPGIVVASTGIIGGTPRQVGKFTFPVTVTEGEGLQADTALFRIDVTADDSLSFRIDGSITATVGETMDIQLLAVGGTPPFSWRGGEELPDEFQVTVEGPESNIYRVRGRLPEAGLSTFLAEVRDVDQRVFRQAISLRFVDPPPPPVEDDDGGGCRAGTRPVSASTPWPGLVVLAGGLLVWRRRSQGRRARRSAR